MAIKTISSARESSGTKSTKKNSANSRPDKSTPAAAKRAASSKRSTATPFTGGGDPRERAVRQHPGRVEQPTVANGRAGLNRQGGDVGDPHPARVPGPMSRQTT